MNARGAMKPLWWLIHKDLSRAFRAQSIWPAMLLLGLLLVCLLGIHIDLPNEQKEPLVGGFLWITIAFAGTLAVESSFASERENRCWEMLTLYPIAPSMLYVAKLLINVVSLLVLEIVLIPAFIAMTDVPLLAHPWAMVLTAALGNIGFAAIGTLVSAATINLQGRSGVVALLFLPLVTPVVLACARATGMLLAGEVDAQWWQWIQFLAAFAVVSTSIGVVVFEVQLEE
jgi:heme exporter protein B